MAEGRQISKLSACEAAAHFSYQTAVRCQYSIVEFPNGSAGDKAGSGDWLLSPGLGVKSAASAQGNT